MLTCNYLDKKIAKRKNIKVFANLQQIFKSMDCPLRNFRQINVNSSSASVVFQNDRFRNEQISSEEVLQ